VTIGGQYFCLDLDTGSSDVGIMSKGCKTCSKKDDAFYDPSISGIVRDCDWCDDHSQGATSDVTCKKVPKSSSSKSCVMNIEYAEGSGFSAELFEDKFAFGDSSSSSASSSSFFTTVGAIYTSKGFNDGPNIDGIIGFASSEESVSSSPTPFDSMLANNITTEDIFTLCLRSSTGALYLGAPPTTSSSTIYTPTLSTSNFYAVSIDDVLVDNQSIDIVPNTYNKGDAIVDSGTSDVCFPDPAFNRIRKALAKMCSSTCLVGMCDCDNNTPLSSSSSIFDEASCVPLTKAEFNRYPDITIIFSDGSEVVHSPAGYLRKDNWLCDDSNHYSIAISSCGPTGSGTILGASFMSEYLVVHDREKQRLGFIPGHKSCPK
jgi:hypothetical protein